MSKLAFFGYEEDPPAGDTSVDTTFTSIMNTPQTTGAKVYTDAKLVIRASRTASWVPIRFQRAPRLTMSAEKVLGTQSGSSRRI
jgi:hypothetical protein